MRLNRLRIRQRALKQKIRVTSFSVTILILLLSLLTATALANEEAPAVPGVRAEAPPLTVTATHTDEAPPPAQESPAIDSQPSTTDQAQGVAPPRSTDPQPQSTDTSQSVENQSTSNEPVQTDQSATPADSISAAGTGLNTLNNEGDNTIWGYKEESLSDEPVPGWTIYLFQSVGGGTLNLIDTTTTNNSGYYEFTGLEDGDYEVVEENRPEWTPVGPTSYEFSLSAGASYEASFLNIAPPASISGYKYLDIDEDGIKDPGEPGLAGWRIDIENFDYETWTITDADGFYYLVDLSGHNWNSYLDILRELEQVIKKIN